MSEFMIVIKKYCAFLFLSIMLFGCSAEVKEQSAEAVAVAFFDAIYNKKDINQAVLLCTPSFAAQLKKHRTAKQVALRLFNMSFDTVEIDAALSDFDVREDFDRTGNLTMLFTGLRQDRVFKDMKKIKLIRNGETWLVDKILADPFASR